MAARLRQQRTFRLEALLALSAPVVGLLTFPHRLARPNNPLYSQLGWLVPRYAWKALPTTCMGSPYGSIDAVRTELLFDLASDLLIFCVAMSGVWLLSTALTSVRALRASPSPRFATPMLVTATLSVLAWAELWSHALTIW